MEINFVLDFNNPWTIVSLWVLSFSVTVIWAKAAYHINTVREDKGRKLVERENINQFFFPFPEDYWNSRNTKSFENTLMFCMGSAFLLGPTIPLIYIPVWMIMFFCKGLMWFVKSD